MIDAVILAAGKGERMMPLTAHCPKPMLDIGGKPALLYTIRLCAAHGLSAIAINLFYCGDVITAYCGDGKRFGVTIRYSYEDRLLGSAGACKRIEELYGFEDTFAVIYGDVISCTDLSAMMAFHRQKKGIATIGTCRVADPQRCGIVDMDRDGRISGIVEKPKEDRGNLVNAGIYILNRETMRHIPDDVPYDFAADLFPRLLDKGLHLYGYPIDTYLIDIGTIHNYRKVNDDCKKGLIQC